MPIWEIAFTPPNAFLESLIKRTCRTLGTVNNSNEIIPVKYSSHENSNKLQDYLLNNPRVFVGVDFKKYETPKTNETFNFTYELRFPYNMRTVGLEETTMWTMTWRTGEIADSENANQLRNKDSQIGGAAAAYVAEGFTLMVNEITLNFVEMKANLSNPIPRPLFQRLPHGKYVIDAFFDSGDFFVAFWIVISGFWAFSDSIHCICMEKEKQIIEILKIAGLSNLTQWLAWFFVYFIKAMITRVSILLMFTTRLGNFPAILTYCNPFVYLILQSVYSLNLLTLAFFISVIFKDPHSAVFFGRTTYFLLALPYFVAREWYSTINPYVLMTMSLLGPSGYGLGVHLIFMNEKKGIKTTFHNINISPDGHLFNLSHTIIMMFMGAVIHIAALLYIEQVMPGRYGIPKKWYFLFTKSFWCKIKEIDLVDEFELNRQGSQDSLFQPIDRIEGKRPVAIYCRFLTKKFSDKVAVSNLSLKLHENQLVVLLGFTGSGKTVTLSMLAGVLKPTSGSIFINGYDMLKYPKLARKALGYAPQENTLFENLTVQQNMQFYCLLRGSSKYAAAQQVKKYVTMLGFDGCENLLASKLKEFQKKKLSMASVLCGNTKIVLIDAPFIGSDPRERKKIWQFLYSERRGRTIVVTTQCLDDGEKVANKIGILNKGKLQAFGSAIFIKERFKKGHFLVSFFTHFIILFVHNIGNVVPLLSLL